jgi:hypothetical protein
VKPQGKCLVIKCIFNSGYPQQDCQVKASTCKLRDEYDKRLESFRDGLSNKKVGG